MDLHVLVKSLLLVTVAGAGVVVMPGCSSSEGEKACERVESLCSNVTCEWDDDDDAKGKSFKSCVDTAKECDAAMQCLRRASS